MKRIFIAAFLLTAVIFCSSSAALAADHAYPVYRLYNAGNQEHLYTPDYNEYTTLQGRGWKGEGKAWYSETMTSENPVYRLYSPAAKEHLYTTNPNEVNTLKARGWSVDFNGERIFDGTGGTSVFRLYNPGVKRHLLTTDPREYSDLAARGWRQEGVAFFALTVFN